jgi:hypothetical protein
VFGMWHSGGNGSSGKLVAIILVSCVVAALFFGNAAESKKAKAAIAHPNSSYSSVVAGTGISLAYAKDYPVLLLYARGKRGVYEPSQLRSVSAQGDRKQIYRDVLLAVKDGNEPEWTIHFRNEKEAKQWVERVMLFAETRGRV